MASFSLVIEYLTGYAVATDPSSREKPEWPPHPARVYMAMAAAHFETGGSPEDKGAQRDALEWLATLPQPDLVIPNHSARDVLSVYVPVNDQSSGDAIVKRSRQPRTFPRVHVGGDPVRLIYSVDPEHYPQHLAALEAICRHVTRIGHSSSLVWVRLERNGSHLPTHQPDESALGVRYRTPFGSILKTLDDLYGEVPRAEYVKLKARIDAMERERKSIKGKGAKDRKLTLSAELDELKKRSSVEPRPPIRPSISHTTSYRPVSTPVQATLASTFDPNFIVLRPDDDATQTFGLESTARVVEALRGTILASFGDKPIPAWLSGHEPNGERLQTGSHLAIAPLAFVGTQYADGHLLGLSILIPKDVPLSDRGRALAGLLFDQTTGDAKTITLKLGELGTWDLVRESSVSSKQTLQTRTYTQPSRSWASVTPIVLDRMPKADRANDPITWREEVAAIITGSCANVGLPEPSAVRVEKTPFFVGSLRAMPGQGGFPQLRKGKFQVHAQIDFADPVAGPLLLGAGRFRGYGLLRPWKGGEQ
jgi:CRISPR-associated protein Csb2